MISEKYKIVPVASDLDMATTLSGDSINMKNYLRATFILGYQTLGGASTTLALWSGAADGDLTSVVTFRYAWMSAAAAAADCDVLGAWTIGTGLTVTHGTYSNYTLVIEVEASAMDVSEGEEWLTIVSTDPAGATGNVQIHAILEGRYSGGQSITALE